MRSLLPFLSLLIGSLCAPILNYTVIDHFLKSTGQYIGSPSIVEHQGLLVSSHDEFGPKSSPVTHIFRSNDSGNTWEFTTKVQGSYWSTLFVLEGDLYLMGTSKEYGFAVIRRSKDLGKTWTTPKDSKSGRLSKTEDYHTAPTPVVVHRGRVWRCYEHRVPSSGWAQHFRAKIVSAPVGSDLLNADSWTMTNELKFVDSWVNGTDGWLEGNLVVTQDGNIVDVLRVDQDLSKGGVMAFVARLSEPTERGVLSFDVSNGLINLPGGAVKFTIRWDEGSKLYWTLANPVDPATRKEFPQLSRADSFRNLLVLQSSPDLVNWKEALVVEYYEEALFHGYHYADWIFSGEDILAVIRVANNDQEGEANSYHNSNFLWFRRIKDFRAL